jgi:hypothetical protein
MNSFLSVFFLTKIFFSGRLSLFLGMSCISLIDFIEPLFYIFCLFGQKRRFKSTAAVVNLKDQKFIREWCLHSNIHGVANIVKSKYLVLKILWFLGLIASLTYCFLILKKNFNIFFSYEVYSKYNVERSVETNFPAFTFCSENELIFHESNCFDSLEITNLTNEYNYTSLFYDNLTCNSFNFGKINYKKLVSASFNGNSGSCIFSIGTSLALSTSHIDFYLHSQRGISFYGNHFVLKHSEENIIGIRRIFTQKLVYPYSNCVKGWESINKTIFNFYKKYQLYKEFEFDYQHEVCLEYCAELQLATICNYTLTGVFSIDLTYFNSECYQNSDRVALSGCFSQCPEKCDEMKYQISHTISIFPSLFNQSGVVVYFDDTYKIEYIDNEKLDFNELVASIG